MSGANTTGYVLKHTLSNKYFGGWHMAGGKKYPLWGEGVLRAYALLTNKQALDTRVELEKILRDIEVEIPPTEILEINVSFVGPDTVAEEENTICLFDLT